MRQEIMDMASKIRSAALKIKEWVRVNRKIAIPAIIVFILIIVMILFKACSSNTAAEKFNKSTKSEFNYSGFCRNK